MKKIKSKKAFTLVEMLCVVIIVVLLAGMLTTGTDLAMKSLGKSVGSSEGELLASTLTTAMTDELRYAGSTVVEDGEIESFFSQKFGKVDGGFSLDSGGHILLGTDLLVSERAYTSGIKVSSLSVEYAEDSSAFEAEIVLSRNGAELTRESFTVKPVNPVKVVSGTE